MNEITFDIQQHTRQLLNAMTLTDVRAYEYALNDGAGMRIWRWDGMVALRPRDQIANYLIEEWAAWTEPRMDVISVVSGVRRGSAEFRIFAYENGRYVEHNRAVFVTLRGEKIQTVDLYCAEPIPSAHRSEWIAPAATSDAEISRLFDEREYIADVRDFLPPRSNMRLNLRGSLRLWNDAHPASNGGGNARWSAEDADEQIEALIEFHRGRQAGFTWFVGPWDTPADLGERMEQHGLVLAGDTACMARNGLAVLDDIPVNDDVNVAQVAPDDDAAIESLLQIAADCFHLTPQQIERERPAHFERIKDPHFFGRELNFLARLDGQPVAEARLILRGGVAYLGGASTLPDNRNRHIYSTLLRRRLEVARAGGHHVAMIHAEPMSRRIVERYGFREYGRYRIYAWMPVIDLNVIRSLVPDE
ncbi:MAG: GNAT family N-acetyltransferase [Chloroflexi bacterium]|nr:GNAT family N-acetyltransferase [Chloroflexota bacterium]